MAFALDDDMRAVLDAQKLCFAATVSPDGRPNLSPKGTIRAWDERRLFFLDIASPNTRRNLAVNPWMELNVVDPLSRRGYRFSGRAALHVDDDVHREAARRVREDDGHEYPTHGAVLLEVERAAPLVSPGYAHVADEREMRDAYRRIRPAREAAFDAHLEARGFLQGQP